MTEMRISGTRQAHRKVNTFRSIAEQIQPIPPARCNPFASHIVMWNKVLRSPRHNILLRGTLFEGTLGCSSSTGSRPRPIRPIAFV